MRKWEDYLFKCVCRITFHLRTPRLLAYQMALKDAGTALSLGLQTPLSPIDSISLDNSHTLKTLHLPSSSSSSSSSSSLSPSPPPSFHSLNTEQSLVTFIQSFNHSSSSSSSRSLHTLSFSEAQAGSLQFSRPNSLDGQHKHSTNFHFIQPPSTPLR